MKFKIVTFLVVILFLFSAADVSAQLNNCGGFTRCAATDTRNNCLVDQEYIVGCGGNCQSGSCAGGCLVASSCSGGSNPPGPTPKPPPNIYQYPTCASGRTLMCGSPQIYIGAPWGLSNINASCTIPQDCGARWPSLHIANGCQGVETRGSCTTNCACCLPSEIYSKSVVQGTNYTYEVSCHTPTEWSCRDWDDVFVSKRGGTAATASVCYCNCPSDGGCGASCNKNGGNYIYNDIITCRSVTTTWSCQPNCTTASPSIPQLISPISNPTYTTLSVPLTWNDSVQTWGTGCPSTTRQYKIFVSTNQADLVNPVTPVATYSNGTGAHNFTGADKTTYYWKVQATNGSISQLSAQGQFTINIPPSITSPWWQVRDGDVTSSNGSISSNVPATYTFNLNGAGGFPGVFVHTAGLSYGSGILSTKNWSANTQTTAGRLFDYTYFKNLIPDNVTPTSAIPTGSAIATSNGDGYEWYKVSGNTTINTTNFGSRKVILFVENGNLTINGNLNVDDGVGFFGAFVDGNIVVGSSVTGTAALEGIFLSDGTFTSSLAATQLHIRGSVASFSGVSLLRNLADDSTAAELFEYAPDQILLFPKKLAFRRTKWAEIAP